MRLFQNVIQDISVDNVFPNKINPNKMPGLTFSKLKLSLEKFGMMNPIIVRMLKENVYEIIDGEWRWRATKELGGKVIQAKIIKATDEEVGKLILASTIKGKHDMYETTEIIEKLSETEDSETLKACNLDKDKVTRRLKYHGSDKMKIITKKHGRNEKDSPRVRPIEKYKPLLLIPMRTSRLYNIAFKKMQEIDKDLGEALLQILKIGE